MTRDAVDVHTHVFNLRYLPLEGIVNARLPKRLPGRKLIAAGLARLLNGITHDGSGLGAPPVVTRPESGTMESVVSADTMLAALAGETPPELLADPTVTKAVVAARANEPLAPSATILESVPQNNAMTLLSKLKLVDIDGLFDSIEDFINWVGFLRHDEVFLMERLFDTYPDVDLFVHHMMDMAPHYKPGKCHYEFNAEQTRRMRRLVERSGGKLMTFVAWSPGRDKDERLEIVKEMILSGAAAGVKIYPPSGYAADDPRNDELWEFCTTATKKGVPVFTHCSHAGFWAKKDYIKFNHPKHWAAVLERFKTLRLCFGHAGGSAGWFGRYSKKKDAEEKNWETSYAKQVFDLCVKYDNVYCETGFLSEVLEDATPFIARLSQCFRESSKFASRILYGTDWHMIERLDAHVRYFEACQTMFEHADLAPYKDLFFYANAVAYLDLPGYEARQSRPESFDTGTVTSHLQMVQEKAAAMRAKVNRD
jgi:predicted TIM-barrel fold metal-dependent hydrolase